MLLLFATYLPFFSHYASLEAPLVNLSCGKKAIIGLFMYSIVFSLYGKYA